MNRFQATLQRTDDRLHLPRATRSRILLEMAADLEDLFRHHRAEGLDESEAARRAEEAVEVSDEALERLQAVHRSGLDRFSERLAGHVAQGWERLLVAVLLAFTVLMACQPLLVSGDFFTRASVFVWPVLALDAIALGLVLTKLYGLNVRRDRDPRRLRAGLGTLLFVAAGSLAVGIQGLLVELFLFLRRFAAGQLDQGWPLAVSALMIVATVTAILAALAWFVLSRWAARIENREADALLAAG